MHDVLLRDGLVRSLNVVTVDLAMRTGLSRVASTAAKFGLPRPDAYPSMALGTFEATPLQIAAAYSTFANGGTMFKPTVIAKVVDNSTGEMIDNGLSASEQIIKPGTAYMINDILSDVIRRGTARRAKGSLENVAIAGKTGTSRDGWFVGYTPNLVCAVWIGFDDNKQLGLTGAEAALPAWIEFMKEAIAIRPSLGGSAFPKPSGIVKVKIDPESGELAGPNCPLSQTVSVSAQFAPRAECFKHMPDLESEYDDLSLESSFESDASSMEPEPLETPELDKTLPTPADPQDEFDDELEPLVPAKRNRRTTETKVNPGGRVELVNAPVVDNDVRDPKAVKNRRP
jgi:penicillin-binding protein 1B